MFTVDTTDGLAASSDDDKETMMHLKVTFVPGLHKIFDESLVNAVDNKQRDPSMDCLRIEIDPQVSASVSTAMVTVYGHEWLAKVMTH